MVMLAAEQPWRRCFSLQASQRSWGGPRRRLATPWQALGASALSSEQALASGPLAGEGLADTYTGLKVRKPVPSSHLPLPSPKEREVKVQEEPQRGMAKMEDHTETKGEDDQKRGHRSDRDIPLTSRPQETSGVLTCLKCNPEPVDLLPEHPEDNLSENVQMSPVSSSSESHVICSDGDPGDVLPPWKPESHAMVFSAPIACCSLLLERLKKEVLGEDHRPKSPGSLMSGKELQHEKSSDIPSRSCSSLVSTSSRPCKQKIPLPLFLLLPGLRSPLPLTRDRGEWPPSPKLPCLAAAKNPGTFVNIVKSLSLRTSPFSSRFLSAPDALTQHLRAFHNWKVISLFLIAGTQLL
ncbi:putative UPF0607 protein FLJ37424 isoform X2 [Neophocaena asiaeorientalis asiaeorientalis]|uniref:UPF0607 protein FLJ37424 isoform X2 n=1 Tax=Neophocaena asiaeorientalis asiaeorientalis TaxID=1706337 RepID=A0A341CCC1_NEOAA|nr:putative UPF0607 protein FLJ37424 isoform X2 [Neophocaena asiaeorientalis asiaeorientalis]XP_024612428.1 putative UPF0607 protein FLJ37424 isoform X2 [Neophocaena asiaeorientalis asiaeorientalis]